MSYCILMPWTSPFTHYLKIKRNPYTRFICTTVLMIIKFKLIRKASLITMIEHEVYCGVKWSTLSMLLKKKKVSVKRCERIEELWQAKILNCTFSYNSLSDLYDVTWDILLKLFVLRKNYEPICIEGKNSHRMKYKLYELYSDIKIARRIKIQ